EIMTSTFQRQRGAQTATVIVAIAFVAIAAAAGYWYGTRNAPATGATQSGTATAPPAASAKGASTQRKVLYWHDPMVPGEKFDKPGKSPFMDMDLVPVYADEAQDNGTVSISPRVVQNFGVRSVPVRQGKLGTDFTAVGAVTVDERLISAVQARSP